MRPRPCARSRTPRRRSMSSWRFSTRLSDSIVSSASNVAMRPESSVAVRMTSLSGASAASRSRISLRMRARSWTPDRARPVMPWISSARSNASASGRSLRAGERLDLLDRPFADTALRRLRGARRRRRGRPGCARRAGTRARRGPPCARRTAVRRRRGTGSRSAGRSPRGHGTARSSGRRPRSRSRRMFSCVREAVDLAGRRSAPRRVRRPPGTGRPWPPSRGR